MSRRSWCARAAVARTTVKGVSRRDKDAHETLKAGSNRVALDLRVTRIESAFVAYAPEGALELETRRCCSPSTRRSDRLARALAASQRADDSARRSRGQQVSALLCPRDHLRSRRTCRAVRCSPQREADACPGSHSHGSLATNGHGRRSGRRGTDGRRGPDRQLGAGAHLQSRAAQGPSSPR